MTPARTSYEPAPPHTPLEPQEADLSQVPGVTIDARGATISGLIGGALWVVLWTCGEWFLSLINGGGGPW